MSSERRILASRANGARSRGPVTPEGKLASSQNSFRHGILSKTIVLGDESNETFLALLTSYKEEHHPATPTEETMIENMAIARWRQLRIWNMETAGLNNEIGHPDPPCHDDSHDAQTTHSQPQASAGERLKNRNMHASKATQAFIAFRTLTDETRALELLNRYEARYERQFRASLACLRSLQAERRAAEPPCEQDSALGPPKLYWCSEEGSRLVADPSAPPDYDYFSQDVPTLPRELGSFSNLASSANSNGPEPPPVPRKRPEPNRVVGMHRRPRPVLSWFRRIAPRRNRNKTRSPLPDSVIGLGQMIAWESAAPEAVPAGQDAKNTMNTHGFRPLSDEEQGRQ